MRNPQQKADTPKPGKRTRRNRQMGWVLGWLGKGTGIAGAVTVAIGGALPWVLLTVFGMPIALPGLVGWGGAVAVGLAVLALTWSRSFPLAWLLIGGACIFVGSQAEATVGREVVKFKIGVERSLAPINEKLAQATVPPIEPFTGIGPARDHLGPGPTWVVWGGVALLLGGVLQLGGDRLRHTCGSCGLAWSTHRDPIEYCPRCGVPTTDDRHCPHCRQPLEKGDRFCVHCGTSAS